jgi:hypothetical protein
MPDASSPPIQDEISTRNDSLLTSLAILNVNWIQEGRSYLDNFLPFIYEVMRRDPRESHRPAEVRTRVMDAFGMDLPSPVINQLLERGARSGVLEATKGPRRTFNFRAGAEEAKPSDIGRQQASLRREQAHLVDKMRNFVKQRFNLTWQPEEAEQALLAHVEAHAAPLLESAQHGISYPSGASGESSNSEASRDFVVSSFVVNCLERDPEAFAALENLVKGCMLAAALYLGTPASVSREFQDTSLYLDTPICLKALGLEGEEARDAATQTLTLAVQHGAKLACFAHILKETDGVLQALQQQLSRGPADDSRTQGVLKHFLHAGLGEADAIVARETLEQSLGSLGVAIIEKPPHSHQYGVDEAALEAQMQTDVGYLSRNTLLHDLDSLTAIHRLRNGRSAPRMETCGGVLITDNYNLVRASRRFFSSSNHRWPLAMLDHELAALVWIKTPGRAPDLPRQQIIADCHAAMSPSDGYWQRVTDEIGALRDRNKLTPEEVAILMSSHEAQRSIMDATLGDPKRVDERALRQALAKALEEVRRPVEQQVDATKKILATAQDAEGVARFEASQRQNEVEELRERITAIEAQRSRQDAHDRSRAKRIAKIVGVAFLVVIAALVTVGASLVLEILDPHVPEKFDWLLRVIEICAFLAAAGTLIFGGSLRAVAQRLEQLIYRRLHGRSLGRRGAVNPAGGGSPQIE